MDNRKQPMNNRKSNRRKLLKSIAAGGGAVVAGKSLPESWTKPVVDSVLLPVHAATTDDTQAASGTNTCVSISIPGAALTCAQKEANFSEIYWVDDTGECPVLKTGKPQSPAEGIAASYATVGEGGMSLGVAKLGTNAYDVDVLQLCIDPAPNSTTPFQIPFKTLSGADWGASGSVSRTATSVSYSNIALGPD